MGDPRGTESILAERSGKLQIGDDAVYARLVSMFSAQLKVDVPNLEKAAAEQNFHELERLALQVRARASYICALALASHAMVSALVRQMALAADAFDRRPPEPELPSEGSAWPDDNGGILHKAEHVKSSQCCEIL
jgi:hypothetical protein